MSGVNRNPHRVKLICGFISGQLYGTIYSPTLPATMIILVSRGQTAFSVFLWGVSATPKKNGKKRSGQASHMTSPKGGNKSCYKPQPQSDTRPLLNKMDVEVTSKPFVSKLSEEDLKHVRLNNVHVTDCVLGQGSYGTVYKAEHDRTACAAKIVDLNQVKSTLVERVEQTFLLECLQYSKLSHPNIVKMLGVFYPKKQSLPVLVMELMEYNLMQLLKKSQNIPMYVKLSILQDVSRGLCYLHAQNPPIVHQALYSDSILFTKGLTAKIGDFKTGAVTVSDQVLLSTRQNRYNSDFLPDSVSNRILKYELPLNVFSFGCIVCHVITQKLPSIRHHPLSSVQPLPSVQDRPLPSRQHQQLQVTNSVRLRMISAPFNPIDIDTREPSVTPVKNTLCYMVDEWYTEERQDYIDMISDDSLKTLVEACLQCNPKNRPHISQVYKKIISIMTGEFVVNIS